MRRLSISLVILVMALAAASPALADVYLADGNLPSAVTQHGYNADEVAVNQGVVAYWYAHGYANMYCCFPQSWAQLQSAGLPLRGFVSPHNGQAINFDDGSLDFAGDMTYSVGVGDVMIMVQTTTGVVSLPGVLAGQQKCTSNACCPTTCTYNWCDISICGFDCWNCGNTQACICEMIQWMLFRSFETYECRYGTRPCNEQVWMASGLAPIGPNWKQMAPFMNINYVRADCYVKKAKVECCVTCTPCEIGPSKCGSQNCGQGCTYTGG